MNSDILPFVILGICVIAALAIRSGKKKKATGKSPTSNQPIDSMNQPWPTKGWHIRWSPGMSATPKLLPNDGCYVDFLTVGTPTQNGVPGQGGLHYLQNFSPKPLQGATGIRVIGNITATGVFKTQDLKADKNPTLGILLQRKGDVGSGEGVYRCYRLFGKLHIPAVPGDFDVTVPLTHDNFVGVTGLPTAEELKAAIEELESYGIVAGSWGGRGHGLYTETPPARITITSMEPQY